MSFRTLVVGGGIGGLSLARELTIRSLPVVVLERAPVLTAVGAGIIMNPNAMRVLERNGLAEPLRERGWPYLARDTHDHRGRRLATRDYRALYAAGRLAVGTLVHRAHLHQTLLDGLPAGTVWFGARVLAVESGSAAARVRLEGGDCVEGDLVVGADGIHSTVRDRVFGANPPRYLGYRSHRLIVENADGVEHFTEFLGRGKRMGLVPISKGELYVWTTFNSPAEAAGPPLASVERVRGLFAEFTDPRVRRALGRAADDDAILCTEIEEIHQAEWARGRAVLLGDAAHALSPNMGQGAGMAMEDAVVLAEELAAVDRGTQTLATALADYVGRRRPRVETVMRLSREAGADGQRDGRLACWWRNRRIRREGRDIARAETALERLLAYPI